MNVQLMLLLALVGPFCAFTHASPTTVPAEYHTGVTKTLLEVTHAATEGPKEDLTLVTGPPTTEPAAAPEEVVTEAATEVATEAAPVATEAAAVATEAVPVATTVAAEDAVAETGAPDASSHAAAEPLPTDPPAVETAAPTEPAVVEREATGAVAGEAGGDVVILDDTVDGPSSGQIVGIVIGVLLAVVIIIAVVIAVVRRMGKYSSAKNKKPAKKESVMVSPLRKKPAKQQERAKFWKF